MNMYWREWYMMALFFFGAILMRSAGCIINDIWDRDLDKQVERTKARPLAAGTITLFQAIALLFFIVFTAFIILLQTSAVAIGLGFLSIIFIVAYPYMKRITWWPQAFLGITFNFGALMGWGAVANEISLSSFILYAGCFFWTVGYDTIYAHQDKDDDALIGIKSTALLFGKRSKFFVFCFYVAAFSLLLLSSVLAGSSIVSLAILVLPACHLIKQIYSWDVSSPNNALKIFKSNRNFGLLVLVSFFLSDVSIEHRDFLSAVLQ